jgi:hypothetical protein
MELQDQLDLAVLLGLELLVRKVNRDLQELLVLLVQRGQLGHKELPVLKAHRDYQVLLVLRAPKG